MLMIEGPYVAHSARKASFYINVSLKHLINRDRQDDRFASSLLSKNVCNVRVPIIQDSTCNSCNPSFPKSLNVRQVGLCKRVCLIYFW